eukprot:m.1107739 g.1107739  ORF g.1107739 m.1107739 type:complete len:127 (-) comp24350_c0_seq20:4008-4388(-)
MLLHNDEWRCHTSLSLQRQCLADGAPVTIVKYDEHAFKNSWCSLNATKLYTETPAALGCRGLMYDSLCFCWKEHDYNYRAKLDTRMLLSIFESAENARKHSAKIAQLGALDRALGSVGAGGIPQTH